MTPYHFKGAAPGPHVLMLGAVHGDEPAGTLGLQRLLADLVAGNCQLAAGELTLIPVVNVRAAALNKRYVDENLNRLFMPHASPASYEQELANSLLPYIAAADYTLDLHCTTAPTLPFAFLDQPDASHNAWAQALGLSYLISGWPQLYAGSGEVSSTEYAQQQGRCGLTVECGQKADPASSEVAYRTAVRTLAQLGLMGAVDAMPPATVIHMTGLYRRQRDGQLLGPWENFTPCHAGQALAAYQDGEQMRAAHDGYIIMPCKTAAIGEEWYYLGRAA